MTSPFGEHAWAVYAVYMVAMNHRNRIQLLQYDLHTIYVVQGLQATNKYLSLDKHFAEKLPDCLLADNQRKLVFRGDDQTPSKRRFPGFDEAAYSKGKDYVKDKLVRINTTTFTYTNSKQKVKYRIILKDKKSELMNVLQRKNANVIYSGHSRYGRGTCFGANDNAGEWWEQGTGKHDGIYRLGYPLIGIPLEDIMHHGYTFDPCEATTKIQQKDCHPDILPIRRLREIKLQDELAKEEQRLKQKYQKRKQVFINHLTATQINNSYSKTTEYWGYKQGDIRYVVLRAGWQNTKALPYDLGKTPLNCKVFCHFGCSSYKHFQRIIRHRKKWQKTKDSNFAYFSTKSTYVTVPFWLYYLLSYSERNDYRSPEKCLEDARHKTNKKLAQIHLEEMRLKRMKRKKIASLERKKMKQGLSPAEDLELTKWKNIHIYKHNWEIW